MSFARIYRKSCFRSLRYHDFSNLWRTVQDTRIWVDGNLAFSFVRVHCFRIHSFFILVRFTLLAAQSSDIFFPPWELFVPPEMALRTKFLDNFHLNSFKLSILLVSVGKKEHQHKSRDAKTMLTVKAISSPALFFNRAPRSNVHFGKENAPRWLPIPETRHRHKFNCATSTDVARMGNAKFETKRKQQKHTQIEINTCLHSFSKLEFEQSNGWQQPARNQIHCVSNL